MDFLRSKARLSLLLFSLQDASVVFSHDFLIKIPIDGKLLRDKSDFEWRAHQPPMTKGRPADSNDAQIS